MTTKTDAELLELHKRALHFADSSRLDYQAGCQLILDFIEVLPDLLARAARLEEALKGYRAAAHWIASDSWDGCGDCIEVLKLAFRADLDFQMSSDEIATTIRGLRARFSTPSEEGK